MKSHAIGIIGAGNSAHALAAYLSAQGHAVHIWARRPEQTAWLKQQNKVIATGKIEGEFPLASVADSLEELARRSEIIFLATITTAYAEIARGLAPHLGPRHCLIAFSSKLGGSLLLQRQLQIHGGIKVPVLETDALFACRLTAPGTIWIRGIKAWNLYAGPRRSETLEYGGILTRLFPGLVPAHNLLQRGLTDFGALAHAPITLANISRIDQGQEFLFYYEGLSERTVVLLEAMEDEFQSIAKAYDTELCPMAELLQRYYGGSAGGLYQAMTSVPNYRHSLAPTSLHHRFLHEDIACTLIPLQQLAAKADVKSKMIDATITMAGILGRVDFATTGRNLKTLGWHDLSTKEIITWMAN